jgi:hypothetical protein
MLVAADHEVGTGTPPTVLVKMPPRLDALDRCAAFVAGRRGKGDQLGPAHDVAVALVHEQSLYGLVQPVSGRLGKAAAARSTTREQLSAPAARARLCGLLSKTPPRLSAVVAGEEERAAAVPSPTPSSPSLRPQSTCVVLDRIPRDLLGVSARRGVHTMDRSSIAGARRLSTRLGESWARPAHASPLPP